LADLTPYGTIRRYEEGKAIISREDMNISISAVTATLDWASKLIGVKFDLD
jgi:hypothetical protein